MAAMPKGPPPAGGDFNRAPEVYAFTWTLLIASIIFVVGRMYSRAKLTRNIWWDDWLICVSLVIDFAIAIMWTEYAGDGYARHVYYLTPKQIVAASRSNAISRALCVLGIAVGKISVAFLIERIAGPSKWRKWMLRSISISIVLTAVITVLLFFLQCQPVSAVWDKSLLKTGKGKCWDPVPLNKWNLVGASYWAFLDFALAIIPVDIVWKLQMSIKKKIMLSVLLSMGIFAGICAAIKTSKVPITIKGKTDMTWTTIELLMWGGIEMNVIIIAACIPTLRPLFLILFNRPGASQYRGTAASRRQYQRTNDSNPNRSQSNNGSRIVVSRSYDRTMNLKPVSLAKGEQVVEEGDKAGILVDTQTRVQVESREVGGRSDDEIEEAEEDWRYQSRLECR